MGLPTIEVTVTTTYDREEMYAELFADGIRWGEVTLANDCEYDCREDLSTAGRRAIHVWRCRDREGS
jgi:hypothetical protein